MVVGLGISRLLLGVSSLVQHPKRKTFSTLQLLWVGAILLELIHFWWWEFALFQLDDWTFGVFFFIFLYTIVLFLQAALLFPDSLAEYDGYEDFFLNRRPWFFGLFIANILCDLVDTYIKGEAHWSKFAFEFALQAPIGIALCAIAIWTPNRNFHLTLVSVYLIYKLSWIFRLFNTVT
ncbi:hypothetical protein [Devosia sp. A449]